MIRRKLALLCFVLAPLLASAQHEVGVKTVKPYVGLSYAAMFNGDLDFRKAMTVGVDLEKRLAKWFSVSAGLAYAPLGGKCIDNDYGFVWKHDYLTVPVTANFYPLRGLAFKVGLQPGISIRNIQEKPGYKNNSVSQNMQGDFKPFDLAVPVGISYELYNVVLDVRWNIGVTSVGRSDPWAGNYYMNDSHLRGANFAYVFTIGYQFEY